MSNADRRNAGALVLGRAAAATASDPASAGAGLVTGAGDSQLLTIAPRGAGQDRSCLIPNLLAYPGRAVVIDVDGRAYAATAEARRAMGHAVVRLDPFGVTGPEPDALDPLDLLDGLSEPTLSSMCLDIAALAPFRYPLDDVIDGEALGLLSGLIGYIYSVPERRAFNELLPTLHDEDFDHSLAVGLDTTGKHLPATSYTELMGHLEKDGGLQSRILARLRSQFESLGSPEVRRGLGRSTVSLHDMRSGAPVTVYLVMPADQLASHSVLLRFWLGTLLLGLARSQDSPWPVLFLLDRCAELGAFPLLESLLTVGSEGALRFWTFWHDVNQLRTTYPGGWREIVAGCGAVQAFGTRDSAAAAEAEALLGLPSNAIWSLDPDELVVVLDGVSHRVRKPAHESLTSKMAR